MKKLIAFFALFLTVSTVNAQTWITNPANGHDYTIIDATAWQDAENLAVGLGGHLVTIRNEDENDWLFQWLLGATNYDRAWIGLFQPEGEGYEPDLGWGWISGEPLVYTNWNELTDEPNNSLGIEDHGEFWIRTHVFYEIPGKWNDTWAVHPLGIPIGVVERIPSQAVPEPSPMAIVVASLVAFAIIARFINKRRGRGGGVDV